MKPSDTGSRKKMQRAARIASTASLRLKPVYSLGAAGVSDAQEIGGGTLSPMLKESRFYTSGRALRA
jgi:hypothetical protein